MQKLIFTLFTGIMLSNVVMSQNWDKHMEVKKMDIRVSTDAFTATTFIEMEFFNPTNTEMEGLYNFELEPGQAITAFQLDLFGKFREGSIEEKWKATNAYNTIVGKRVDPALLKMDYANHYSLRIYPVPAMSSRRITMTIQQLLVLKKEIAVYSLPLKISDIIKELNVDIRVAGSSGFPSVIKGLLTDQAFSNAGNVHQLSWKATALKADKPLSFSIPLSLQQHSLCIRNIDGKSVFGLRIKPGIQKEYTIKPQKVSVFWDVSVSGGTRNIYREISFLKQYVATNKISQLTIISFNEKIKDTAVFYTGNNFNSRWMDYLQSLSYEGATQFGALDLSSVNADVILVFSDGKNSFGKALPVPGQTHVYCINSATYPDIPHLEKIIGVTGGRVINLATTGIAEGVESASKAENILLGLSAGNVKLSLDQKLSDLKEDVLLLTGSVPAGEKTIILSYGNNGKTQAEEKIGITVENACEGSAVDRINMLSVFDSYINNNSYWMDGLAFGKQEKVITLQTAYIVLEKIEDYIKFNILPPKELEAECDMNIFVKADEERRRQYKKLGEADMLTLVANAYNERINFLGEKQPLITLVKDENGQLVQTDKIETGQPTGIKQKEPLPANDEGLVGSDKVMSMSEVVVTAMGQTRLTKEVGYSITRLTAAELTQGKAVNIQNGLTGKVSGLNVTTVNSGVFGDTRITLRGIRSLTGNNEPMLILDGLPIDLRFINSINPNDIRDVTVLKSAAATAIYGPDGVNGALVLQSKKGSKGNYSYYWSSYRLKDRDDEDYLADIKKVSYSNKLSSYYELKKNYGDHAGFYFDMAQHLYESGYHKSALPVLFSAADITGGDKQVLKAMGYMLETWKEFDEAIRIYKEILTDNDKDLQTYRDLALAYYQNGNYQQSINSYYEGILKSHDHYAYYDREIKSMMLQEMNAIILTHPDGLDLSKINQQLVKPLVMDLRITLQCNNRNLYGAVSIVEPDGSICSYNKTVKSNAGRLMGLHYYYYDSPQEYQAIHAEEGKYKLRVSYVDYGSYYNAMKIPTMIKITTFKNFGKPDQTLHVENVIMDNQHGDVEIAEMKW